MGGVVVCPLAGLGLLELDVGRGIMQGSGMHERGLERNGRANDVGRGGEGVEAMG